MRRVIPTITLLVVVCTLSACASIISGSRQDIGFASTPSNAIVSVDGMQIGRTPVVHALARKDQHAIKFELDGYMPQSIMVTKSVNGWVWGNILLGGLIGLVVDASTGAMYKLSPEQVSMSLGQATQAGSPRGADAAALQVKGGVYVAVVMQPDPTWQRIGQLTRD